MWAPLVNVNHLRRGAGEVLRQIGAVPAGLLVLPLACHESRNVDVVDERDRVQRVGDGRVVGRVFFDFRQQVCRLPVQFLVGRAGLIAVLYLFVRPVLAAVGAGRFGVVLSFFGPGHRETGVEDAAGIERRRCRIEHRQGRDRLEGVRSKLSREELADPAVGDAEHAHLVVEHPRLFGDGFNHVICIEVLQRFEIVERAARAAGTAHVHVHHREAHQVGQLAMPLSGPAGFA